MEPARLHQKPFGLLNIAAFSASSRFSRSYGREGFIRPKHLELVIVKANVEKIMQRPQRVPSAE